MTTKIKSSTEVTKVLTGRTDQAETGQEVFMPNQPLGELLNDLAHEQKEIDRRETERLARLREIQSYD